MSNDSTQAVELPTQINTVIATPATSHQLARPARFFVLDSEPRYDEDGSQTWVPVWLSADRPLNGYSPSDVMREFGTRVPVVITHAGVKQAAAELSNALLNQQTLEEDLHKAKAEVAAAWSILARHEQRYNAGFDTAEYVGGE